MEHIKKLRVKDIDGIPREKQGELLINEAKKLGFVKGLKLSVFGRGSGRIYSCTLNGEYRMSGHVFGDTWRQITLWAQTEEEPVWGTPLFIPHKEILSYGPLDSGQEIPWILYPFEYIPIKKQEHDNTIKKIKMWIARWFKVIKNEQAKEWGLTHYINIHGDEINRMNCRSIWKDSKGRTYRVELNKSI